MKSLVYFFAPNLIATYKQFLSSRYCSEITAQLISSYRQCNLRCSTTYFLCERLFLHRFSSSLPNNVRGLHPGQRLSVLIVLSLYSLLCHDVLPCMCILNVEKRRRGKIAVRLILYPSTTVRQRNVCFRASKLTLLQSVISADCTHYLFTHIGIRMQH